MRIHNILNMMIKRHVGAALLALATLLSGCGGGGGSDPVPEDENTTTDSFTIGGTISGNDASVTLSLNGVEETFVSSPFTFTDTLEENTIYSVQFVSTPSNQVCTLSNNNGTISTDISNIEVLCTAPTNVLIYDDAEVIGGFITGDFNGDGLVDLAFSIVTSSTHTQGSNNNMTRFVFGAGNGVFQDYFDVPTQYFSQGGKRGNASLAADFNNDGFDDLATYSAALEIFSGNNTNTPQSFANVGMLTSSTFYSLDIDNNGFEDVISFNDANTAVSLFSAYRNNGDGTFTGAEGFPNIASNPLGFNSVTNIRIDDFDGDGRKDILALGATYDAMSNLHASLALFINNGDGTFAVPASYQTLSDDLILNEFVSLSQGSKEITSGDFDSDGDMDIAITSNSSFLQILSNDGSGQFTAGQRVVVGTTPIHVRTADFNNDGLLDLVSVNDTSRNIIISYGNGDGTFGDNTGSADSWLDIQIEGDVDLYDMDIADVDLDGALDILIAENSNNATTNGRGSVRIISTVDF